MEYVADVIGNDWQELLYHLDSRMTDYDASEEQPSKIVMKYFASIHFQVAWEELKTALEYIGREDVVRHIMKNTLITKGKHYFVSL